MGYNDAARLVGILFLAGLPLLLLFRRRSTAGAAAEPANQQGSR
jgi:hypothetical protein